MSCDSLARYWLLENCSMSWHAVDGTVVPCDILRVSLPSRYRFEYEQERQDLEKDGFWASSTMP